MGYDMKRILIIAYSRQAGGAEKSALKLQRSLLDEGYHAEFATFVQSVRDFYPLNPNSQYHALFPNLNRLLSNHTRSNPLAPLAIFKDLLDFRRKVSKEKYEVVISFGAGVGCVTFLGLLGLGIRQITSERIDPDPKVYKPSLFSHLLRPYIYRHGVVCSVQTKGFAAWVESHWRVKPIITPNYFDTPQSKYEFPQPGSPVVAVGRPAFQKGFDILLQAWKIIEDQSPRELWLITDDKDKYIANLVNEFGCTNVKVMPLVSDLNPVFNKCSAFVSSSRFEGYPNAIAEAILFGIPVISTISSDVVTDWEKVGICKTIPDLSPEIVAESLINFLKDEESLKKLSRNAILLREKFTWSKNKIEWIKSIEDSSAKI